MWWRALPKENSTSIRRELRGSVLRKRDPPPMRSLEMAPTSGRERSRSSSAQEISQSPLSIWVICSQKDAPRQFLAGVLARKKKDSLRSIRLVSVHYFKGNGSKLGLNEKDSEPLVCARIEVRMPRPHIVQTLWAHLSSAQIHIELS